MDPRIPTHRYEDPLDRVWLGCAERVGLVVRRDPGAFATTDGRGVLRLATQEHLDPDDCVAQMVFHELCHALVEGPSSFDAVDWGLDNVARVVNEHTEIPMIFVEGHTDADGNDNYNLQLSDRRAKSVMRYLLERGSVDVSRLKAKGFGESQPIADNKSEQGKQTNRRVEFRIVDKDGEAKDMTKEGFKKDDAAQAAPAAKADDDDAADADDDDLP